MQLQVVATRPWCGPRGYIQVGMRGMGELGRGIVPRPSQAEVGPTTREPFQKNLAIHAPPLLGGEVGSEHGVPMICGGWMVAHPG